MPSLRFKCQDWFEVTCESELVPSVGEQVRLLEHGLKVAYRVREISWSFIEGVSFPGFPRHPARRVSSGHGHGSEDQEEAEEAPRRVQA